MDSGILELNLVPSTYIEALSFIFVRLSRHAGSRGVPVLRDRGLFVRPRSLYHVLQSFSSSRRKNYDTVCQVVANLYPLLLARPPTKRVTVLSVMTQLQMSRRKKKNLVFRAFYIVVGKFPLNVILALRVTLNVNMFQCI